MTHVKIRYYVEIKGRAYWQPTPGMKAEGFAARPLGPPGPAAWARAEELNAAWDAHKAGTDRSAPPRPGSLADVFQRYRGMQAWAVKAPRTREEWWDVWQTLGPIFGDLPVAEIDAELVDRFYARLERVASLHRRHRVMKVFRALLNVAIAMKLTSTNPTEVIRNRAPHGRSAVWRADEVRRLAAAAWKRGYRGLAVAIRLAYDTQLSPVDVRRLTPAQRRQDGRGVYFVTERAKTGRRAYATLSGASAAMLDAYLAGLGVTVLAEAPLIRNRSGQPYTKDKLAADFRAIRAAVLPGDTRQLMDLRRTGNVEAAVGGARPQELSAKAGNTIGTSSQLFETYTPVQLEAVRQADAARERGRAALKRNGGGSKV